ncbi:hypothetical protein GCM10007852_16790 [Agaribacter marinus]|uniref:Uncharacterized protein n=1 Tax=Agaribacter marinus TaxID=1431249 RepID=A0AA37WH23_9ALTE|nr:hypothetical protein GCM10007852_16790 [Agaribacter marinus]
MPNIYGRLPLSKRFFAISNKDYSHLFGLFISFLRCIPDEIRRLNTYQLIAILLAMLGTVLFSLDFILFVITLICLRNLGLF